MARASWAKQFSTETRIGPAMSIALKGFSSESPRNLVAYDAKAVMYSGEGAPTRAAEAD
jgi:hypothetical protein